MRENRISNVRKSAHRPTFPLIIIFLALVVISMPVQEVYGHAVAGVPTVVSIVTTSTTTIVVTFNEHVNSTSANLGADFTFSTGGIISTSDISGLVGADSITLTTDTPFGTGALPTVGYTINEAEDVDEDNLLPSFSTAATDGVAPTMDSAITTSTTTIDVTFSEDLAGASVAAGDFTLNLGLTVLSATESSAGVVTITTTTAFNAGDTPAVTLGGGGVNDVAGNTLAVSGPLTSTDGQKPAVSISYNPSSPTSENSITVTFTWTESVVNFVVGDLSVSAGSLSGFSGSGASYSVTWNLFGVSPGTYFITVAQDSADDLESPANTGPASATTSNLSRLLQPGSGCRGDCSAPTLGIDEQFTRVVENGFTYNGDTINVERYFTPYPLITVDVGKQNKAVFKIYDDLGPDNIRHFDFAFGLDIGQVMGTSNAMIVWNKSHDGTETVTLVDPHNALENVRVLTSEGKCKADSTTNGCLIVTVFHTFREPLDFDMVGTNVWDSRLNAWQNFYNHGVHIEGQSLNSPDEYVGIYKGSLIHIIETGKNTAVDTDGNTWTFDNTWIKDYISIGKIDDPITSQLYDRNHVRFDTYKQGQELIASSLFETYYKTSVSHEPAFSEIDDIKFYEFPDTIDKKFDPVLLAKMHQEDIRAQKYLEEMFAKMYPGLIYD